MKKGLLLSLVASTMMFAGGDIAPVEPVAEAPASECKEFYGSVGFYYETHGFDGDSGFFFGEPNQDLGDVNLLSVSVVLGVEKALGTTGLKFGIEVAGWTSLGLEAPDWRPVADSIEGGELSQLYLSYAFNNTAIKAGRFALPQNLSPFAWSDRTAGVLEDVYEGFVAANTDIENTTLYGVYVHSIVRGANRIYVADILGGTNPDDELGLFVLGFVNTSIADTTISGVGYYVPNALMTPAGDYALWALFGTIETKMGDMKLAVNAAYVDADDVILTILGGDATFAASAQVSGSFGAADASLAVSYVNDGVLPLAIGADSFLYTTVDGIDGQLVTGFSTVGVLASASTKVGSGELSAELGYYVSDDPLDTEALYAGIGYSFTVAGIETTIEYRHIVMEDITGESTNQQILIEAVYNF